MFLDVEDGNATAIQLYEQYGFTQIKRRKQYYRQKDGTFTDALVMQGMQTCVSVYSFRKYGANTKTQDTNVALIVQKFGGTSVADTERIRNAARKVKKELDLGNQVAVVVSAMSGVTNQLVGYVNELSPLTSAEAWSEYDHVVSSGEQVTSGLLALCLLEMGIPARSFTGWQIPLETDKAHGKARIAGIDRDRFA